MHCPPLSFFHVPVPKGFLSGCLSVTPGGVRYVAAGKYGYEVLDRLTCDQASLLFFFVAGRNA